MDVSGCFGGIDEELATAADSAASRRARAEQLARCAADAACASYGVPPGACGAIGGEIAGHIIAQWDDWFGNSDEWAAYRERQAYLAAENERLSAAIEMRTAMSDELYYAAGRIAAAAGLPTTQVGDGPVLAENPGWIVLALKAAGLDLDVGPTGLVAPQYYADDARQWPIIVGSVIPQWFRDLQAAESVAGLQMIAATLPKKQQFRVLMAKAAPPPMRPGTAAIVGTLTAAAAAVTLTKGLWLPWLKTL